MCISAQYSVSTWWVDTGFVLQGCWHISNHHLDDRHLEHQDFPRNLCGLKHWGPLWWGVGSLPPHHPAEGILICVVLQKLLTRGTRLVSLQHGEENQQGADVGASILVPGGQQNFGGFVARCGNLDGGNMRKRLASCAAFSSYMSES